LNLCLPNRASIGAGAFARLEFGAMSNGLRTAKAEASGTTAEIGAIDLSFLDRVTFRDRSLAREVLVLFGEQADSLLVAIAEAGDERTRFEAAHKLKGAARGVGAFDVARAAEEIETAKDAAELGSALAHLTTRITEARIALTGLIRTT
jgi:HPt (histidine-containing phosphotransfer) domain-containing protein